MSTGYSNQATRIRMRIGDSWRDGQAFQDVRDPYRGDIVAQAPVSTPQDCEDALAAAYKAKKVMAAMPGFERAALLRRAADNVAARVDAIARAMTLESGKAIRDSLIEVQRSTDLLRLCAEEAVRIQGEHIPMDASAVGAGKIAMLMRYPVGVVAAITPFNGPVNLAAHKLGPALAAGNSFILKPSPKAPLSVHLFIEAILDAGVPDGAINTLYGDAIGPQMVSDSRVDFVSFTGSIPVGKIIRNTVGMKRVALALPLFIMTPITWLLPRSARATRWRLPARVVSRCRTSMCTNKFMTLLSRRSAARWTPSVLVIRWTWQPRLAP